MAQKWGPKFLFYFLKFLMHVAKLEGPTKLLVLCIVNVLVNIGVLESLYNIHTEQKLECQNLKDQVHFELF